MILCEVIGKVLTNGGVMHIYKELPYYFKTRRDFKRFMKANPDEFDPDSFYILLSKQPFIRFKKESNGRVIIYEE